MIKFDTIVSHDGIFHLDDGLCVAFAEIAYPGINLVRTSNVTDDMKSDNRVLVCDVGREYDENRHLYDHHNDCPNISGTDIKQSAIGLFTTSNDICFEVSPSVEKLLTTVQAVDNGVQLDDPDYFGNIMSYLADFMNPAWDSNVKSDDAFREFVDFLKDNFAKPVYDKGVLTKDCKDNIQLMYHDKYAEFKDAKERAEELVKDRLSKMIKGVVTLPVCCPWKDILVPSDAKFVVYPSQRGGYNLQCVPPEVDSFDKKIELPWNNCSEAEGMIFVAPSKFIAGFSTEDQAITAGMNLVKQYEDKTKSLPVKPKVVIREDVVLRENPSSGVEYHV